jgi:hypothetical protein
MLDLGQYEVNQTDIIPSCAWLCLAFPLRMLLTKASCCQKEQYTSLMHGRAIWVNLSSYTPYFLLLTS